MEILYTLGKGFMASAGLIIAIGAQNAFVIKQGILRQHLLLTALLCSFLDAFLVLLGVLGFGAVLDALPSLLVYAKYFAALYLLLYGGLSLKSALAQKIGQAPDKHGDHSMARTIISILALTLLNPHVYLDTVILLGSLAAQEKQFLQIFFALGAIAASFLWFFTLTYGSTLLAPCFSQERTLRYIDGAVAIIMWTIAMGLLFGM